MSMTIVKVQRPLNDPDGPWLIYDRAEKHVEHRISAIVSRYTREKMGDAHKAYFKAAWSSVVGWGLSDRVPDQDW